MIPKAGLGVWTSQKIMSRSRFGPYEGDITKDGDEAHATGYSWQVCVLLFTPNSFLWHQRSKVPHRNHFICCLSVSASVGLCFCWRWTMVEEIKARFQLNHSKEYIWFIYWIGPFFGDLKNFPETKNKSRFYILKLYFLLHYNQFYCSVNSLLNIALQSWCILFKIRKINVFWPNRCFLLLS